LPKDSDKTPTWDWAKFIGAETEEELDMIAAQSEVMKTAVSELYRVSSDADVRLQYELREKARRDAAARELYCIQQGLQQGEQKKEAEIVQFFRNGGSIEEFLKRNS
jgi:hypothetical protein